MTLPSATGATLIPKILQLAPQSFSLNDRQFLNLVAKSWADIPKKLPPNMSQFYAMVWLLATHQEQSTENLLSKIASWGISRDRVIRAAIAVKNRSILIQLAVTRDEITHAITTEKFASFLAAFEPYSEEFLNYLTSHLSSKQIDQIVSSEIFTNIASFLDMPEIYQWAHENHTNFAKKIDDTLSKKLELAGYNTFSWILVYRADYFKQLIRV